MNTSWDDELARLLNDLLAVQEELLGLLGRKREMLLASNAEGLTALVPEEDQLIARLHDCMRQREALLARAAEEGLPSGSIRALSSALPRSRRAELDDGLARAGSQARLLRHHSLAQWVVVQRTLIHLAHMLEIIATGGRLQPTYGGREAVSASGALVDRAA
jgi:hypothetical protein